MQKICGNIGTHISAIFLPWLWWEILLKIWPAKACKECPWETKNSLLLLWPLFWQWFYPTALYSTGVVCRFSKGVRLELYVCMLMEEILCALLVICENLFLVREVWLTSVSWTAEMYISPKINISSPKMALHETSGTPCPWIVIFLHGLKKRQFFCTWK